MFSPLTEIFVCENHTFDENEVLKTFAQDVLQDLVSTLDYAWEKSNIGENLDHLEELKTIQLKNEKVQRKSLEPIDEETLGINIKMRYLLAKRKRLEKLLKNDRDKIAEKVRNL